jgi:nitrate reductase NapE component
MNDPLETTTKKEPKLSLVITLTVIALLCVAVTGGIALRDMFH